MSARAVDSAAAVVVEGLELDAFVWYDLGGGCSCARDGYGGGEVECEEEGGLHCWLVCGVLWMNELVDLLALLDRCQSKCKMRDVKINILYEHGCSTAPTAQPAHIKRRATCRRRSAWTIDHD